MEAAVEVAAPSAVVVARLMGSQEGFGCGRGSVVVEESRWRSEGACSSAGRKDDTIAANVLVPSFWHKVPGPERCLGISQPSSLLNGDVPNDRNLGSLNPPQLEVDVKRLTQKSTKIERKSTYTKRSVMAQMGSSKSKLGLYDANGISPELVSSSASRNTSEKNQITKQNSNSSSRRGEKRNSRVKHKSKSDPFSLKNGMVGFNSAAGGNNFPGMYGLKPDIVDITKYANELPLHDLISCDYTSPRISKDKGKTSAASSSNDLMQTVRKACSVLQTQKGLQAQKSAEIDTSCIRSDSTVSITIDSAVGQADVDKGDNSTPLLLSSDEVQESDENIRKSTIADSPLYTPKDIFKRLALPLPKDLDLLLSDASKTASKINTDPRASKPAPQRTGLPPFPWSHSLSGHAKLGSDAVKLSANRTTCQGRWLKVANPVALQKGSAELLVDFESLAFDKSLVPSENSLFGKQEDIFASTKPAVSTTAACSTSKVASDECPSSHAAAQTLLDMAARSKENPCAVVKLLKRPSQVTMKASPIKRCDSADVPNPKIRPSNALKLSDGVSSKKPRPSKDSSNACISHTDLVRQGRLHQSAVAPVRSPPRKLFRDSNSSNGINLVKKSCVLKAPRGVDRPTSSKPKFSSGKI